MINNSQVQNNTSSEHPNDKPITRPRLSTAQYLSLVDQYISTYSPIAVQEMSQYGVPASIILAQAMHESGIGRSSLATQANNHFGVKCTLDWIGPGYYMDDDRPNECFRKYASPEESFQDHMAFLQRKRYANLFASLDSRDYKAWAYGLKNDGYATNPQYPQILIGLIEKYNLNRFDGTAQNGSPEVNSGVLAQNSNPSSNATSPSRPAANAPMAGDAYHSSASVNYNASRPKMIVYDTIHKKVIKVDTIYTYAYQKPSGTSRTPINKSTTLNPSQGGSSGTGPLTSAQTSVNSNQRPEIAAQDSGNPAQSSVSSTALGSSSAQQSINPPPPNYPSTNQEASPNLDAGMYKVHQGDTLYGISKKFNISLEDLRVLNNLPDNGIKIDQVIRITKP